MISQDSGPNTEVAVFTIPVGQGDSTVIKCPNGDISIVDMGCKGGCQGMSLQQYVIYIETEYFGNDYKKLKKVFLTHPDEDHMNYGYDEGKQVGLLVQWLEKGVSLDIYLGERAAWFKAKRKFVEFLELQKPRINLHWEEYGDVQICSEPKTTINIIASDLVTSQPDPNQPDSNKNARSMVMSLMIGNSKKMLFLGDFELQSSYNYLLSPNLIFDDAISDHDILMVPHHGSGSKGNPNVRFYNEVKPKYAIVSSAMWSDFKHPKIETLQAICGGRTKEVSPNFGSNPIGWIKYWEWDDMSEDEFPVEHSGFLEVQDCDVEIFQTSKVLKSTDYQLNLIVSKISAATINIEAVEHKVIPEPKTVDETN